MLCTHSYLGHHGAASFAVSASCRLLALPSTLPRLHSVSPNQSVIRWLLSARRVGRGVCASPGPGSSLSSFAQLRCRSPANPPRGGRRPCLLPSIHLDSVSAHFSYQLPLQLHIHEPPQRHPPPGLRRCARRETLRLDAVGLPAVLGESGKKSLCISIRASDGLLTLSQQHSLSKLMPVEVYPLIVLVGTICTGSVYAMAYTLNKGDVRLFCPVRRGHPADGVEIGRASCRERVS